MNNNEQKTVYNITDDQIIRTFVENYNGVEDQVLSFRVLTNKIADTYEKKNHDYGNSFEKSLDKFGLVAAAVRMGDKMNRFETLINNNAMVNDESIKDTLLDLATYALMTAMYIDNNHVGK